MDCTSESCDGCHMGHGASRRAVPAEPAFSAAKFPPAARHNRLQQTLLLNRNPLEELLRARARHGPVFTLRILPYRAGVVCATDTLTNREVLTDQKRFAAGDAAGLIEPIVGANSLILTPSPRHARNRKLLMPPFHGARIADWGDVVGDLVEVHLSTLMTGGPVPVRPWAQRLTLDVILRVAAFGIESPERRDIYRGALDKLMAPGNVALLFAPAPLRRDLGRFSPGGSFRRRRDTVDRLLLEEIAARRADPSAAAELYVLSMLLAVRDEGREGFSNDELRDELKGLLVAGHETTATALAWTLHLLARNPATKHALVADLEAGSDRYLKATIKEGMRLRAPVFDAVRIAVCDTELGGHPVPAGAYVSAMFCVTHMADDLWPEPQAFRPQRHLDESHDTWSLTPFGGGARRCLGAALAQLELEVVLRRLLDRALPEPCGPAEAVRLLGVTLVPAAGGRVLMRRPS